MNNGTRKQRLWGSPSWGVCVAALMASSGCGSTTEQGDTQAEGPTLKEACATFAATTCAQLDACSSGFVTALRYGDEATCETRAAAACELTNSAPSTSVTASHLEACASALGAESCDATLDSHVPEVCHLDPGALADGHACIAGGDCQSTFCAIDPEAACGVCAPRPSAGDPCEQSSDCGRDLVCVGVSSTCEAAVGEGGACDKGHPCEAGFTCVGAAAAGGLTGTCDRDVAAAGEPCDATAESAPDCAHFLGLFCDPNTKTCLQSTTAAGGEACGFLGAGSLVLCAAGGMCITPAGKTTGTCLAAAKDGEACDAESGPACSFPARCVVIEAGSAGTCALLDATKCP